MHLELCRERYDAAIETATCALKEPDPAAPQYRWRMYFLRAEAFLAKGDRDLSERDVQFVLAELSRFSEVNNEAVRGLMLLSGEIGLERMVALIQASPLKDLLLPLSTALLQDLGQRPRVPVEVEEVAKDIRADLAELRGDVAATAD